MQEPFAPRSLPASPLLRLHPTPAVGFPSAGLPSSRAELPERAMSLCPVPPGAAQNESAASVLVSATMTRLTTGDLSVRSFEAYIRDFTFVWLIPLSSWASARRSPSAQPTFLSACRFLCRTDSFHSVSSAELCLAHHGFLPFILLVLPSFAWRTIVIILSLHQFQFYTLHFTLYTRYFAMAARLAKNAMPNFMMSVMPSATSDAA